MAAYEETIAEAARPLRPGLADEQDVKKVKFYARNQRDCGAASAVGAATVAISLLIGDGKVALDAFYVLLYAQTLLIFVAVFFAIQAATTMDQVRSVAWLSAAVSIASAGNRLKGASGAAMRALRAP